MPVSQMQRMTEHALSLSGYIDHQHLIGRKFFFGDDQQIIVATVAALGFDRGVVSSFQIYFHPVRYHGTIVDRLTKDKAGDWHALRVEGGEAHFGELHIVFD